MNTKIKYRKAAFSFQIICFLLLTLCLYACFVSTARCQVNASGIVNQVTTNVTQQTALDNAISALGFTITNFSINPYLTYAPQTPKGDAKVGGGLLTLYDFNQNAGAGLGLDWLGQLSLVSGDLQLKAPFHLSTVTGSLFNGVPFVQQAIITPFVLGGVGTAYTGNGHFNGNAMVITDVGGAVEFGHLWGGRFDTGVAWGKWVGKGPYGNVTRYHLFLGFTKGF